MKSLVRVAVIFTSLTGAAYAEAPTPTPTEVPRWETVRFDLEDERAELRVKTAVLGYKIAFLKYTTGASPVSSVVKAARQALVDGLKAGPGSHARDYERRILELQNVVTADFKTGKATKEELNEVQDARLDALLGNLLMPMLEGKIDE